MGARHPSFPHRWQRGREIVRFPVGVLVLRSWVGASKIGAPSMGCSDYRVAPEFLLPFQEEHLHCLNLYREARRNGGNGKDIATLFLTQKG